MGVSFDQPTTTAQITGLGALNLLEAIRLVDKNIRFLSGEYVGNVSAVQAIPQTEDTPFSIHAALMALPSCMPTG